MKIISSLSTWVIIIPVIIGFISFRKLVWAQKLIMAYCALSLIAEFICIILLNHGINNMPVFHIYTIVEFGLITQFYKLVFIQKFKQHLIVVQITFAVFAIVNSVFWQHLTSFNTFARSIEALIIVVFAIYSYYRMLTRMQHTALQNDWGFFINTGFFIYFSSSLLTFILSNYIIHMSKDFNIAVWTMHGCFCIIMYLFMTLGLWKRKTI